MKVWGIYGRSKKAVQIEKSANSRDILKLSKHMERRSKLQLN